MSLPPFVPLSAEETAMLAQLPLPVLVLDGQQRVRFVNQAGLRLSLTPDDDPVGSVVWERYPALVDSGFHREYARVLREGTSVTFEEYRPEADRWFAVTAYPAGDGLVAMLRDITDDKRLGESRQRAEQTMRLAQESVRLGSFSRDLRLGRSEWSETLCRILGLDFHSFDPNSTGRDLAPEYVHADDRELVQAAWQRALITGQTETVRHRVVRADGVVRVVDASFLAALDQHDEPDRIVGTLRDVTDELRADEDRAQFELQMQQAQKLESLGVLAGGIAHDFNNLLVGILGNASLALLDLPAESPARGSVAEIEHAAQRAAELTRELLAYAGKGRFVVEAVDCSRIVREMTALLRTAVSRDAQVSLQLAEALPPVEADVTQLRHLTMNLVTNASEALGDAAGSIHIRTYVTDVDAEALARCVPGSDAVPGAFVAIEVSDSGSGMDEATQLRIFDPFFSTKFAGRGLGLAATLGIVRSHHGAIQLQSTPGSGTTIALLLPVSAGRPPREATAARREMWTASGEVLVVDDEPSVRTVSRALLRRRGFTVTEAAGGLEAVALVRDEPTRFKLILLDLSMPELDGYESFRQLREVAPLIKVILMSGYSEQEVQRRFAGRGLAAFLQKPFRADDLDTVVRRVLGDR